jgi:formylglycine-generating enzyme required for sulfatase activity
VLASLLAVGSCRDLRSPGGGERSQPAAAAASPSAAAAAAARSAAAVYARCSPACSSIERCAADKCAPNCPPGEVYVPATGARGFIMGRGEPGEPDQSHRVLLTRPFCMDETEVTVAAYRQCVEAGACELPQLRDANANYRPEFERDRHPVNMVDWTKATKYCQLRGKSLPTEAQWEWAAGHGDFRVYPWGNEEPNCENNYADMTPGGSPKTDPAGDVGCHGGGTSEVKAHPKGKTRWPAGDIYDLGGNVWEWTADCYLPYPASPQTDPSPQEHPALDGDCYVRALRGGGWNRSFAALQVAFRAGSRRTYTVPGLGFRCVRNPRELP